MRLRLWTVSDPARVLVVRKHYHKLAHASNRSPRRLGSMDLTETCDVLSWRKRVLMQGVTSCLQQTRAPTSNQLGSNNHIRIGLVARICRSQSSKDDQFRQGRGSIPRFGNLSFAHSMDERRIGMFFAARECIQQARNGVHQKEQCQSLGLSYMCSLVVA